MPPARAVVARVMREMTSPDSQPVMASNLIDALRKKYGQGEFTNGSPRFWMFNANGTVISQPAPAQRLCMPATVDRAFPMMGGRDWLDYSPTSDYGGASLNSTVLVQSNTADTIPACTSLALAQSYDLGDGIPPNMQMNSMTVSIESPGLLDGSRKAAHDWLQQEADAIRKRRTEDASKRPAPKL
jgi:hypothetical protein